jgi:hypothetical protein
MSCLNHNTCLVNHNNVTNLIHFHFHNHFIVSWSSTCFGCQASIFRMHYTSGFWCELCAHGQQNIKCLVKFLSVAHQPSSALGRLTVKVLLDNIQMDTHKHTTGRTPLNGWSDRRRGRYLHNIQQTQPTKLHALSSTRNRDSRKQVASDLRLKTSRTPGMADVV